MSDVTIPEDIREEAIRALDTYRNATGAGLLVAFEDQVGAVATGIVAERERCAKIAEEQQLELVSTNAASEQPEVTWRVAAKVMRDAIAQAIRSSHE